MDSEILLFDLFVELLREDQEVFALSLLEKVRDTYSQYRAWNAIFLYSLERRSAAK